jgi:hypothetical protein
MDKDLYKSTVGKLLTERLATEEINESKAAKRRDKALIDEREDLRISAIVIERTETFGPERAIDHVNMLARYS